MDVILDFIVEYYIWILVISIFLILVLIGYIADQKRKLKKIREEKNNEGQVQTPDVSTPIPEPVNIVEQPINEGVAPIVEQTPIETTINEVVNTPSFESVKEEEPGQNEVIDSSLFAPIGDVSIPEESAIFSETPVPEIINEPVFNTIEPDVTTEPTVDSVQPEIVAEPVEEIIDLNIPIIEDTPSVQNVETTEPINNTEVIEEIVSEPQSVVNTWEPELIEENKDIISN